MSAAIRLAEAAVERPAAAGLRVEDGAAARRAAAAAAAAAQRLPSSLSPPLRVTGEVAGRAVARRAAERRPPAASAP